MGVMMLLLGHHVVSLLQLPLHTRYKYGIQILWKEYPPLHIHLIYKILFLDSMPFHLMDLNWPVLLGVNGKATHPTRSSHLSVLIPTSIPRNFQILCEFVLVVWDIQTGVIIWKAETPYTGRIIFREDQGTVTLVLENGHIHTYNAFDGKELYLGGILLSLGSGQYTHWAHGSTFQFAVNLKTGGEHIIDIKELQPSSTTPLHTLSSFSIPPQDGDFSFSPVSFHASFTSSTEVVVLDIQDSKLLLQVQVVQEDQWHMRPAEFSPDGCFFACGTLEDNICIWQNTPTGYLPWSSHRLRLPFDRLLFSPTTTLILCYNHSGMQRLQPANHPSPTKFHFCHQNQRHLVAYSVNQMYVAMARQGGDVINVLNCLLGTSQQFIDPDMEAQDIKILDNALIVVDRHRLVHWDLEAGGTVDTADSASRVVIDNTLAIDPDAKHLALSYDCSEIAFVRGQTIFLHNLGTPGLITKYISTNKVVDLRFSPSQHQIWLQTLNLSSSCFFPHQCVTLAIMEGGGFGNVHTETLIGQQSWVHHTPHEYNIELDSNWVVDSGGKKLLWLPHGWRTGDRHNIKWSGDFLAMVGSHHPEPIIIQFHP